VQSEIAFGVCCALYCILILVRIAKDRRSLSGSQYYYIAGILIFFLTAIVNIIRIGPSHVNTIRIGLIIFELTSTLALALEFSSVSRAYQEARAQETRLRMINASMEHTQEMQDNFMAIMNHEMRTPLTVIAGYAALNAEELKQKHPQDGEMIRNMQLIKNEALRMGRIVEQSEEGARATAASGQTEEADIRKIFEDARDFCRPICEKRENEIVIDCPEDLNVNCMRDSMLQLLYNLVINASRHTSKGVISLSCSVDGDHVLIKVSDDGEGMDEETRIHAFERGFSKDGGHGLGLALCKEIAEWHKGEIYIEPDTSAGTTVALKMPL
jgi:signal transduction histidine kinase